MFVSSDRTQSAGERTPVTSAHSLPLVDANGPELVTAVTSHEHRRPPRALGAVESGEHSRSLLANETIRLRLDSNALALARAGEPVVLSGGEADEAARLALSVRDDELADLREEAEEDARVMRALRRHRAEAEARAEVAEARLGIAEEDLARSKDAHGHDTVRAVRAEAALGRVQALADEWDALPHEVWKTAARALRARLDQPGREA